MSVRAKPKSLVLNGENTLQHGALTLEFIPHDDTNKVSSSTRKKVRDLLTEMYVRAQKRGRPKLKEEKEAA